MPNNCQKHPEKDRKIRDVFCSMLDCVNSGLTPATARICIELMRHGVQPKQLAEMIRTLKQEVRVMNIESGLVKTMENMKMKSDFYAIRNKSLSSESLISTGLNGGDSAMKKGLSSDSISNIAAVINQDLSRESIRSSENESILKQIKSPILKCAIEKILNEMSD
ncbi:uncharacterized protein LOC117895594 [Drosophila subobscura]|uniref:uncharacterized protein LOC117895594 n=1 Tax=Drosophila subobscura TaxID=7241 RepID=UPI00155ACC1B|nr:uncharacterized protein LOC117895594 [Drosophila subobscura]